MTQVNLFVKMRNRLITIENKLTVPKGERYGGGVNRELFLNGYKVSVIYDE